jgi:hypothetical protein
MIMLVIELYGVVCALSTIVFLAWAWRSKERPDLDEDELEFDDLERIGDPRQIKELKRLIQRPRSDIDPLADDLIRDRFSQSTLRRPVKQIRRLIQSHKHHSP